MKTTKTERLLIEAKAMCCRITGRSDVNDDLLTSVFRSLELEADLETMECDEDGQTASDPSIVH